MIGGKQLKDSQLGYFGASLALMLAVAAALVGWRWGANIISGVLLGLAVIIAIVFVAVPNLRRPIYDFFCLITYPIQWTITLLLLALLFFLVVTPIGLILKLRRFDPLQRTDHGETTYWRTRSTITDLKRYFKTY